MTVLPGGCDEGTVINRPSRLRAQGSGLRVVGLSAQIREEDLPAARFGRPLVRFKRHKYRINLRQLLGIVDFGSPPFLVLVVGVQNPQAPDGGGLAEPLAPDFKGVAGFHQPGLIKVVSIKDQRLAFRVEYPSKGLLVPAFPVRLLANSITVSLDYPEWTC